MNTRNRSNQQPSSSGPQPLYQLSTQFRHWRFSQSGLEQARRELNEGAVGRVKSKLEEERNVELPSAGDGPAEPSQIEYLTVQDELELVTFYLSKISQLCRASIFNFPETVEATAMSYLKRFYLRNTCMDYHPKNIMSVDPQSAIIWYQKNTYPLVSLPLGMHTKHERLTCLFLATKTENTSISIDSFASRIPKTTNEDVLALEFLVAQSLKFQFKVHHAHLAARGIYLDLQNCPQAGPVGIDRLGQAWPEVCALLRAARLTDLEFLWTPSQIACAAWWTADRAVTEAWLKAKADRVANTSSSGPTADQDHVPASLGVDPLLQHIQDLSQILIQAQHKPIDKDRVTAVDRRLRFCRNPEKDPNSALFKIKQAQLDTANLAKHHQKFPAASNQDPFS